MEFEPFTSKNYPHLGAHKHRLLMILKDRCGSYCQYSEIHEGTHAASGGGGAEGKTGSQCCQWTTASMPGIHAGPGQVRPWEDVASGQFPGFGGSTDGSNLDHGAELHQPRSDVPAPERGARVSEVGVSLRDWGQAGLQTRPGGPSAGERKATVTQLDRPNSCSAAAGAEYRWPSPSSIGRQ